MEGLSEVAKQGILGILLVAAIGAIIYLYRNSIRAQKECQELQNHRIGDWKEIAETVKDNSMVMRDWISANETRTRAIEATVRAQELTAASQLNLGNQVESLADTIKTETERYSQIMRELATSNREVRDGFLRLLERQK